MSPRCVKSYGQRLGMIQFKIKSGMDISSEGQANEEDFFAVATDHYAGGTYDGFLFAFESAYKPICDHAD